MKLNSKYMLNYVPIYDKFKKYNKLVYKYNKEIINTFPIYDIDMINFVISHEYGHIYNNHTLKHVLLLPVFIHIIPGLIDKYLLKRHQLALNFKGQILFVALPMIYILRYINRRFEKEADLYANNNNGGIKFFEYIKSMEIKILGFNPNFGIFSTHPSHQQRINYLKKTNKK